MLCLQCQTGNDEWNGQAIILNVLHVQAATTLSAEIPDLGMHRKSLIFLGMHRTFSYNWTFFTGCYGWGATSECQLKIAIFERDGLIWQRKIYFVEGDVPLQPFFMSENYTHWSFTWYKNVGRSFFRFVTNHAFDREMVRQMTITNTAFIAAVW